MQVTVDSLSVQYKRLGEGQKKQKVLILHGWGDSVRSWQAIQEALAKKYDVTIVDLPGFGDTDVPPAPWGLDEYLAFTQAFLKKIKLKTDVIIGHNSGGALAMRGLAHDVLRAKCLVLVASSGIRSEFRVKQSVLRVLTKAGKVIAYPLPRKVKRHLRQKLHARLGSGAKIHGHMQEIFQRLVTDDTQGDAAKLQLPTLLVYGQDDLTTPPSYGRIFRNLIAGSKLEILPAAGHYPHVDQPQPTLDFIADFIDRSQA